MRKHGSPEWGSPDGFTRYDATKSATIGGLRGTVLEIGAGRGRNFALLHPSVTWIGCEPGQRRRAALAVTAAGPGPDRAPYVVGRALLP